MSATLWRLWPLRSLALAGWCAAMVWLVALGLPQAADLWFALPSEAIRTPLDAESISIGINSATDLLYVGDAEQGTLDVVDASDRRLLATIPLGFVCGGIAVNPVTNRVYVTNPARDFVSVVDGLSNHVVADVLVGPSPTQVAVNPVTNRVYVASGVVPRLWVVDGEVNTVVATLPLDMIPDAIAVDQQTGRIVLGRNADSSIAVLDDPS